MDDPYWSRRLARALNEARPELDLRWSIIKAYEDARTPDELPQWVKDWADEALADVDT